MKQSILDITDKATSIQIVADISSNIAKTRVGKRLLSCPGWSLLLGKIGLGAIKATAETTVKNIQTRALKITVYNFKRWTGFRQILVQRNRSVGGF